MYRNMYRNLIPLDFEVSKEPWNIYVLSDGTKLKQRLVLTFVSKIKDTYDQLGRPIYQTSFMNLISVVAPEDLRGEPTYPPPTLREVAETASDKVLISKVEHEEPSSYKFEDGTEASFKTVITSIKRSSKYYDQFGMPFYSIDLSIVPSYDIPKSLWKNDNQRSTIEPH